jgi:FlaA1/EpsC-like NDP-sugar epimerase
MDRNQRLPQTILGLSRNMKRALVLAVDIVICIASVAAAYALRLDGWLFPVGTQWISYGAALAFALPIFVTFGLYRAIYRYAGWGAMMSVVRACTIYGLIYSSLFTLVGIAGVPRSIGILQPLLLFLVVGASRALARYWLGGGYKSLLKMGGRNRVLIYGAGSAGRQLAAALANSEEMQVIGFVDDDPTLQKSVLNGKRIHGSTQLSKLIDQLDIDDLLLALPSASRQRRNEIIEAVRGSQATVRTLPGVSDLAHGRVTVNDLRELDIEDLLGRDSAVGKENRWQNCTGNGCRRINRKRTLPPDFGAWAEMPRAGRTERI